MSDEPPYQMVADEASDAEIEEMIRLLEALPGPVRECVRKRLYELLATGRLYTDKITAVRAPYIQVQFQPSQFWLDFLSALRAGDLAALDRLAHGGSLQGG